MRFLSGSLILAALVLILQACASLPSITPTRTGARARASQASAESAASRASAASAGEVTYPAEFDEPMPLFTAALGTLKRPVKTDSERAQAYFDQGLQMMYAFAKEDASRSFREARLADPECAGCYWAEAWSWGSYLNGPMRPDEAPRAFWAAQKALSLKARATDKEAALIDAVAVRYVADYDPASRAVQDTLYSQAMESVARRFPDDLDIATLYAESLFLLEPRRGTRDVNDPDVKRLYGVLEAILAKDITHPGACHLYVHATESSQEPERAEACVAYLGDSIPGASHINHMPSHTYSVIGRWGDAVRANIQAWHSDLKAEIGEGFAIYPSHNLHMLVFAGSMDGQSGITTQAGKDYAKLTGNSMYQALSLLRFGRFDEIAAVTRRPSQDVPAGLWDFAQGYASLRMGDPDFARAYLARVQAAADTSSGGFRFHSAAHLLGLAAAILEGEIARADGRPGDAIRLFRSAVAFDDSLDYDEPEPLPFAARHWLGNALLEAGEGGEAEAVFRADLEQHPHNGWSLYGVIEARRQQGLEVQQSLIDEFADSWARSDTWIRGAIF